MRHCNDLNPDFCPAFGTVLGTQSSRTSDRIPENWTFKPKFEPSQVAMVVADYDQPIGPSFDFDPNSTISGSTRRTTQKYRMLSHVSKAKCLLAPSQG